MSINVGMIATQKLLDKLIINALIDTVRKIRTPVSDFSFDSKMYDSGISIAGIANHRDCRKILYTFANWSVISPSLVSLIHV